MTSSPEPILVGIWQEIAQSAVPSDWPGYDADTPVSRTATAAFSIDALAAVQAARGDMAAAAEDYLDYAQRHAAAEPAAATGTESVAKPTPR